MGNKRRHLLIVTQVVDCTDPFLGFFHGWLAELAQHVERIEVICLREGEHSLPDNVHIHSLGKSAQGRPASGWERLLSRMHYTLRFYQHVWTLRAGYDTVFVHMNQEYVLLAGWLWKLLGKRIYLWRNHYAGGFLTDIAAMFSTKVFCTSRYSYTAKYKHAVVMPVGVDTDLFTPRPQSRAPRSVLFFGRFSAAKKPDVLLEALAILCKENIGFRASFYGSALPKDAAFREQVIRRAHAAGLDTAVTFYEGVPHTEAPDVFSRHEIFVNLGESGMYDKTIFEAAASGCLVLAASRDFAALTGERLRIAGAGNPTTTAEKLREVLALSESERQALAERVRHAILNGQDLRTLSGRLVVELSS